MRTRAGGRKRIGGHAPGLTLNLSLTPDRIQQGFTGGTWAAALQVSHLFQFSFPHATGYLAKTRTPLGILDFLAFRFVDAARTSGNTRSILDLAHGLGSFRIIALRRPLLPL
jgi:hypothetical protein